ncbi:MAG TPA: SIR2 family protein [Pyrinomonadaceae bacterium]|nr:SIR2 family protein [Pyrinomonadaceae bacterium]
MARPPYGEIVDLLNSGKVVPFLGAGVNFGMRQPGAKWDDKQPGFLPSGAELSRFLAAKSNFPSDDDHDLVDLAKVASYFVETSGRPRLRERLREVFDRDFDPCDIHTYLAEVPAPLLVVTTNYDDLTERAFVKSGKPYDLVVHPTDRKDVEASVLWWPHQADKPETIAPNKLFVDLNTTTVIYKMHGTVARPTKEWDSYVITEEDYVDFLSRMTGQTAVPAQFMRHFRTRHFLFMGYGLNDWNLRVVLNNLRSVLPSAGTNDATEDLAGEDLPSWAIQFQPSDLEVELWQARSVKIYDVDINEFVKQMRAQANS